MNCTKVVRLLYLFDSAYFGMHCYLTLCIVYMDGLHSRSAPWGHRMDSDHKFLEYNKNATKIIK